MEPQGRSGQSLSEAPHPLHNLRVPRELLPAVDVPEGAVAASRAFGSPVRLAIIRILSSEPVSQAELARRLGIEPSALRKNLAVLRGVGVLQVESDTERGRPLHLDPERVHSLTTSMLMYLSVQA